MDQWDYLGLVPKGVNADVNAVCWTNHFYDSAVHRSLLESQPLEENTELETTAHPSPQTGVWQPFSTKQKKLTHTIRRKYNSKKKNKKKKQTSISRHSNEQTRLIFKLQAITVLLISRFRSQEGSACTNTSGCVILLHSEREKSTQKSQMTSNLIQLWTYCTWFTSF